MNMGFNLSSIALGNILGQNIKNTDEYKQDMAETGDINFITFAPLHTINVTGTYVVTKYLLTTDSFVLDHPVYGELDSSVLKLDGGYLVNITFPLSFPINFSGGIQIQSGLL